MKIKTLLLATIICLNAPASIAYTINESSPVSLLPNHTNEYQAKKNIVSAYASTLMAGSVTGALTGKTAALAWTAVERFLKRHGLRLSLNPTDRSATVAAIIAFITIVVTENRVRTRLINEIHQSLNEHGIYVKTELTADVAWLASWIACLT